jgi:hypothetical protein
MESSETPQGAEHKPQNLALVGILILLLLFGSTPAISQEQPAQPPMGIRFADVAAEAGVTLLNICGEKAKDYIAEVNGNGAAFFDYDNDGDMDLLLVNGSTLANIKRGGDPIAALYANNGKGKFTDVTARSGITQKGWGMGGCVADYDNNGFQDVYLTAFGPNILYRNNGDGTFTNVTEQAGVGDTRWGTNCAFGDYDRDGYVDLYVANYLTFDEKKIPQRGESSLCNFKGMVVFCGPQGLPGEADVLYRNNGNGKFTDVSVKAGIHDPGYYGFGVIFSDLDNDGWLDIYVANDSVPNFLFRNNRDGTFSEVGLLAGVALNEEGEEQAGMGVDVGDYNNDGYFDIFVTNFSHDSNTLYQNNGNGIFSDVTFAAGLGEPSLPYLGWGTGFVDFDNDGLLDIFVANGHVSPQIDQSTLGSKYLERKQLYRNLGNGRFREVTEEIGGSLLVEKSSRGTAFGDYDNDGDLDILVINLDDRPTLLRNEGNNGNHWLTLKLVGTKSNRDAIGARVTVTAGNRVQIAEVRSGGSYLSHNDSRVHFGLGEATRVKRLEVRWPSGGVETWEDLQGDQVLVLREGHGIAPIKKIQ